VQWDGDKLTGFELPGGPAPAIEETPPHLLPEWILAVMDRVRRHLIGDPQDFADLPYNLDRVPLFHRSVLTATLAVKSGHTTTYGAIAAALGQPPVASRAVGTALGANPWPLLIPCHRVVAANGRMTGFSGPGGVDTKAKLLALEGAQLL
jgi:methylated-DNA-[protein]-cysteine S-methyltransferase